MDLEDFKTAWQEYDKKLSENLKLNKALLKKANLNASRMELRKPLQYELLNVTIMILAIPAFALLTWKYSEEITYLTAGIIFCVSLFVGLILSIRTITLFYHIDYYHGSIMQLQEQLAALNKRVLKAKKIEMLLIPLYTVPPIMILLKTLHNIDFLNNLTVLIVYCVVALALTYAGVLLVYKFLYDKKIKNAAHLLNEIKNYQYES